MLRLVDMAKRIGFLFLILLAWAGEAHAQYSVPSQASRKVEIATDSTQETTLAHGPIAPADPSLPWELGASLNFITSEASLGGEELEFTDLMLLRTHALVTLGRFEVFAGSDILPKQPSYTNEHIWQGGLVGARGTINESFSAWGRVQGGPQIDKAGFWAGADAAVRYQYSLQKFLFFESSLGASHTQLFFKDDVDRSFFVDEVFTTIGLSFREPRRDEFAIWFNFDYYYPVFHRPTAGNPDPTSGASLDPQPRVNMHLGALGAITDNVSLFVDLSILDRGDLETGNTTLPIINTGFDQQQITFGFMRHFGGGKRR